MKRRRPWRMLFPGMGVVLLLSFPAPAVEGARAGMRLCAEVLLPALFPVSVLVCCVVRSGAASGFVPKPMRGLGRSMGLSPAGMLPVLLGLAGGFPLGAQLLAEQNRADKLTPEEAVRCSALCNNAGPAFLLAVLGRQVFGSVWIGLMLGAIQLLSLLLIGFLQQLQKPLPVMNVPARVEAGMPLAAAFPEALWAGICAMLRVAGTVVFFSALLSSLKSFLPISTLPVPYQTALWGSIELSGSVSFLRQLPVRQAFLLAAGLSSWGGLCVHMQAVQFFAEARLPVRPYLRGKLLQTGFSLALSGSLLLAQNGSALCFLPLLPILAVFLLSSDILKKIHWKNAKHVI